jgi:Tol biopolymer transport system component/DNA-binding winged helix-turn-helix (wHTH) protein
VKQLQPPCLYDFCGLRLDADGRVLSLPDGTTVPLTVKELEILLLLAANAGSVVAKSDLIEAIWPETFVEEGTLTRNVSWLRKKLAAAAPGEKQFIETLPKRGYRFLPAVTRPPAANEPAGDIEIVYREKTRSSVWVEETVALPPSVERPGAPILLPPTAGRDKGLRRAAAVVTLILVLGAAAAAIWIFARSSPASAVVAGRTAAFSGLPGREGEPSFSPDGKQMAFVWNGGESKFLDVYVKLIGEGEPVRLTSREHDTHSPVFAPDGRRIAYYMSFLDHTEIYIVSALGGSERKLCDVHTGGTSLAWSPDGRTIAVADQAEDGGTRPETSITAIDVASGSKTVITSPSAGTRDFDPSFSPDGGRIAFIRSGDPARQDVYVASADGESDARQLTHDTRPVSSLAWSRDGNIYFSTKQGSDASGLWRVPASGGEPAMIVTRAVNPINIAVAPDGRSIAIADAAKDFSVAHYTVDLASAKAGPPTFLAYIRQDHSPQISPDGSMIALSSDRSGQLEIWVSDAAGKNQRQLTTSPGTCGSPRFSPDGKFIAYDVKENGKSDIFIAPVAGGESRRIADPAHDVMPSFSPDGQTIYFCSDRSGQYQIWKMPIAGGQAMQVTHGGGIEALASPDGKTVYYLKESGSGGLWRTSPDGSGGEELVEGLGDLSYWRSWAVAQNGIYFVSRSETTPYHIKFYDIATHEVHEVAAAEQKPVSVFPALSATRSGSDLLYSQQDQNSSTIILAELP